MDAEELLQTRTHFAPLCEPWNPICGEKVCAFYGKVQLAEIPWPVLVIHTLVAFAVARPSAICAWIDSNGSFSFDQK